MVVVAPPEHDPQDVLGEGSEEFLGRRRRDEPAVVEDRHVVADALDIVEDVGGVEDRRLALERLHELEDVLATDRVERRDRLVEQDHGRSPDERLGDAEALAHAAGIRRRAAVGGIGEADPVKQLS